MRKRILCLVVLTALMMMTACTKPGAVDVDTSPVASTSATASVSATPSPAITTAAAVSATPGVSPSAAVATPEPSAPDEIESSGDMKAFVEESTSIVRGKFTKLKEKDFNSIRDDKGKPHESAFIHQNLYEFEVTECYKGKIKAGTTIVVALETESKMNLPSSKLYKCERYIEPKLGEEVIQQLVEYDSEFKHYLTSSFNEPQRFSIVGDNLFVLSNDKKTVETFEKGLGKPGAAGIPLKILTDATSKSKK